MFANRLTIISCVLTITLAADNWIEAAEPIIVFQSNRDGDDEILTAMDDGTVKQLTRNKIDDIEPTWSPDGSQIVWFIKDDAIGGEAFNMMIMDADGGNKVNMTPNLGLSLTSQPTFSPDGNLIAFSSRGALPNGVNNNVAIVKFAEGTKRQKWELYNLSVWGAQGRFPDLDIQDRFQVWSPDGALIAWQTRREGNFDIWVTDVIDDEPDRQKKVQKNLTAGKDAKKDDLHPRFSPDATKLLFESKRDGDWEIFVMDSRTGENVVQLTNNEKNDKNAEWSRNGKKIVFESKRDGNNEIYVMDADGNNPVNLTNDKGSDAMPKWSPNNRQILFESKRDGNRELYVMGANGGNPVNISNDAGNDRNAQWRGLGAGQFASKELAVEPQTKRLTTLGHIKQTALLQNYPNPFNPETWIPYILAKDSAVTIHIYTVDGQLVRTLTLGYKKQGAYLFRTQAAYWDGNNDSGEAVGSGVYFYELRAGGFSATQKMVVAK